MAKIIVTTGLKRKPTAKECEADASLDKDKATLDHFTAQFETLEGKRVSATAVTKALHSAAMRNEQIMGDTDPLTIANRQRANFLLEEVIAEAKAHGAAIEDYRVKAKKAKGVAHEKDIAIPAANVG